MRRMILIAIAAAFPAAAFAAVPSTQPGIQATDVAGPGADPVAKVNGQPIGREQMTQLLLDAYGKKLLKVVVSLEVAKQQAKAKNLTITRADIDDEEAKSFPDELRKLPDNERVRLLDDYLERNGFTRVEWRLFIERQAYLRKLCSNLPPPDEKLVRQLFNRNHGERVEVRDLEVESWAKMNEAKKRLANKEPFELVAREMSLNKTTAPLGGLLKPFDVKDPNMPEDIREAAFLLKKPGDRSDEINYNGRIHLLQLVKRYPPENVKFEDVSDKLTAQVREIQIRQQMEFSLRTILAGADIEIFDPILRKQVEKDRPAEPAPGAPKAGAEGK
ncbi:MAG: peptidyl-prolyl cis-trans isomerase [Phycisphaerae bacterium]|nr:peptidyl-prolyl cis-trans isomerase [Phycisphaerae bacterium]